MAIYWPETLPLKIQYGAEVMLGSADNKVETDFEYGPKKRRLRFTNQPQKQTVTVTFNDAQYDEFIRFYTFRLVQGIKSFIAPVLVGSKIRNARVTIADAELPVQADTYNHWTVPLSLEVVPLPGEADPYFLVGMWGTDLTLEIFDILQYEVNVHYPLINDGVR